MRQIKDEKESANAAIADPSRVKRVEELTKQLEVSKRHPIQENLRNHALVEEIKIGRSNLTRLSAASHDNEELSLQRLESITKGQAGPDTAKATADAADQAIAKLEASLAEAEFETWVLEKRIHVCQQ